MATGRGTALSLDTSQPRRTKRRTHHLATRPSEPQDDGTARERRIAGANDAVWRRHVRIQLLFEGGCHVDAVSIPKPSSCCVTRSSAASKSRTMGLAEPAPAYVFGSHFHRLFCPSVRCNYGGSLGTPLHRSATRCGSSSHCPLPWSADDRSGAERMELSLVVAIIHTDKVGAAERRLHDRCAWDHRDQRQGIGPSGIRGRS